VGSGGGRDEGKKERVQKENGMWVVGSGERKRDEEKANGRWRSEVGREGRQYGISAGVGEWESFEGERGKGREEGRKWGIGRLRDICTVF
jgi:hypothetical protein